ncbi:protein of unknown function DUF89 [Pseudobacteroides cellulosolvens ATCC 35603 = DSM 2933]|uniref:Damage-control phosphatase ARMT1-like metal-binding domain-containing protein n=1 Tax=Pseudobacteroides cellulosolvens ATCC 35603 = DSM 2933 TaxID=398512 RepID=A0A0L6JSR1_9FIRM|nr:protein of unknown function DUF89 [Pseudobacteroides cellulosolvens ATCC 35603 = DSM 2933]
MKLNVNCLVCNLKQTIKVTNMLKIDSKKQQEIIREVLLSLAEADFDKCNPEIMKNTWKIITRRTNTQDPYSEIKRKNNLQLLEVFDDVEEFINSSEDEFLSSLKIAIIGNMIDFAANDDFDCEGLNNILKDIKNKELAIDNSKLLFDGLKNSNKCLYIGDNC